MTTTRLKRWCIASLAIGRTVLGVAAVVRPDLPARPWLGAQEAGRAGVRTFGRAMGGRDLALGLGALAALRGTSMPTGRPSGRPTGEHDSGDDVRSWVAAGVLADAVDVAATLLAWRSLAPRGRVAVALVATTAVALGTASLRR